MLFKEFVCSYQGALGFIPRSLDFLYPVKIVRCSADKSDQPLRNEQDGFCSICRDDEVGLVISEINDKIAARRYLEHYQKLAANLIFSLYK